MQKIKNGEKSYRENVLKFYSYWYKRFYTRLNFNYDPNGLKGVSLWGMDIKFAGASLKKLYRAECATITFFVVRGILSATKYLAFGKINTFVLRTPYGYTFFQNC